MAIKTGRHIYIGGTKRTESPISLTGTYNISQWKQPGDSFNVESTWVYDDGTESGLSPVQTHKLLVPAYTSDADATSYMDAIAVPTTSEPYLLVGTEVLTGEQVRYAWNKFVTDTKAAGAYQKAVLLYPEIGGTVDTHKINAISPSNTAHYLQYEGEWKHDGFCSYNLDDNSSIKISPTYMSLGLTTNDITVGSYIYDVGNYEYENSADVGGGTLRIFGNAESSNQQVQIVIEKNRLVGGLQHGGLDMIHNRNDQGTLHFMVSSNGDGNANYYYNKEVVHTEAVTGGDLPDGQDAYIRLHGINTTPNKSSMQLASMYFIGHGMTAAEVNAWTDATKELMNLLKRKNNTIPRAVLVPQQVSSSYGIYWPTVYKSSEWPEFTTTKSYFTIFSSDHDETDYEGGIWWGEMDDPSFNGFVERGLITSGLQSEVPFLKRIPTSVSGLASDTAFLYFHTINAEGDVFPQRSKLITTSGGNELHLCTWNVQPEPFPHVGDEDHAGYARVNTKEDGTFIAPLITQSLVHPNGSDGAINESTDGLNFTRTSLVLSSFFGDYWYNVLNVNPFKRNGIQYGFIAIADTDKTNIRIAVATLDSNFLPVAVVEEITGILDVRTLTAYVEGYTAWLHFKGGDNQDTLQPTYEVIYDLTNLD